MYTCLLYRLTTHTWRVNIHNWRRFRYSKFHGSRRIIGRMNRSVYICMSIRGPTQATSRPPPEVGTKRIYDWYSLGLEALQKLRKMWASHDIKETNYGKSVSGLCRLFTLQFCHQDRDCEAMDPYYDLIKSLKKDFILHSYDWKCLNFFDRRVRLRSQWDSNRSIQIDKNFITQTFRIYNFIISRTVRNGVPFRPTDDEVVYSKRLGNKVLVDLNRSNPLTVIWDALVGQKNSNIFNTILSVSKWNGPQPPPSHIKPITFGNEFRTYDNDPLVPIMFRNSAGSPNRPFAQLLPGLETGHPVTVGQSPADDFGVPNEHKAVFLCLMFRTVLSAIHMQVSDRPSPDAPSLTQAIIVQMVYYCSK